MQETSAPAACQKAAQNPNSSREPTTTSRLHTNAVWHCETAVARATCRTIPAASGPWTRKSNHRRDSHKGASLHNHAPRRHAAQRSVMNPRGAPVITPPLPNTAATRRFPIHRNVNAIARCPRGKYRPPKIQQVRHSHAGDPLHFSDTCLLQASRDTADLYRA
jgi:hypothetical protein